MDNRVISIQSQGRKAFDLAIQLMFDNAPGGKATHYFEHPIAGFILLWHEDSFYLKDHGNGQHSDKQKANKLPYGMDWKASADLAWNWLQEQSDDKYKDFIDHDGDNDKGFRIYNEAWGHVADSHYGILAVYPIWAWYGK